MKIGLKDVASLTRVHLVVLTELIQCFNAFGKVTWLLSSIIEHFIATLHQITKEEELANVK